MRSPRGKNRSGVRASYRLACNVPVRPSGRRPRAEQASYEHNLSDVIRRVVDGDENRAEVRLPGAVREADAGWRHRVGARVGDGDTYQNAASGIVAATLPV